MGGIPGTFPALNGGSSSRVFLEPRCGINCSCGGLPVMERPIDLSLETTRSEQDSTPNPNPILGLLRLSREVNDDEAIGTGEEMTAQDDAEENVDVKHN